MEARLLALALARAADDEIAQARKRVSKREIRWSGKMAASPPATRSRARRIANARYPLLDTIPSELVFHVLTALDARSLLRAASACKTLRTLEAEGGNELWQDLTLAKWPTAGKSGVLAKMSWKAKYKFYTVRTANDRSLLGQGEVLTAVQLNERFEFFIEMGNLPYMRSYGAVWTLSLIHI